MAPPDARAFGPRLEQRLSQSLVMTPQLQQAIKLLQLSNLEVNAFVDAELERNPLLERDDVEGPAVETSAEIGTSDTRAAETILDTPDGASGVAAAEAPLDADFSNSWDEEAADTGGTGPWREGPGHSDFDEAGSGFDNVAMREKSLREHLLEQIEVDFAEPADRIIAVHLLEHLDESGYFTGDVIAAASTLRCPIGRVDAALAKLQQCDPPGVFARNLRECLSLQLREKDRLDPAMQALLANLDLLARRDIAALTRACGVDAGDLAEMVAEIKALNPKPGLVFDTTTAQTVVPDVLMRPAPGGGWIVELNQDTLPRVLINQRYYARVSKQTRARDDKEFLAERLQAANWLVKSLHQRAETILKVATEIVRQQEAFFAHGIQQLRPLVLRDISEAIQMHESTVSRVTNNKFLASPHGIYELKYFFTSAIPSGNSGESHSAESVRYRIKTLVEAETPQDILSDDTIVELLRKEGVEIARRTVAKYRDALRIPSSVQRRREKSLGL
jgi:RNA polymerase sigma-54 factor